MFVLYKSKNLPELVLIVLTMPESCFELFAIFKFNPIISLGKYKSFSNNIIDADVTDIVLPKLLENKRIDFIFRSNS